MLIRVKVIQVCSVCEKLNNLYIYAIPYFLWHNIHCACVCVCVCEVGSVISDSSTLWTITHQAPLSMQFFRQEYWSGLPCPPPGDLPDPGIKPASLMSPALAGRFFTIRATWEAPISYQLVLNNSVLNFVKLIF